MSQKASGFCFSSKPDVLVGGCFSQMAAPVAGFALITHWHQTQETVVLSTGVCYTASVQKRNCTPVPTGIMQK